MHDSVIAYEHELMCSTTFVQTHSWIWWNSKRFSLLEMYSQANEENVILCVNKFEHLKNKYLYFYINNRQYDYTTNNKMHSRDKIYFHIENNFYYCCTIQKCDNILMIFRGAVVSFTFLCIIWIHRCFM